MGEKPQNEAATTPCDYRACFVCCGNQILYIIGSRTCSFVGIAGGRVAQERRLWLALGTGWVWRLLVLLVGAIASTFARALALHPPRRKRRRRRAPQCPNLGVETHVFEPPPLPSKLQTWMRWHRTSTVAPIACLTQPAREGKFFVHIDAFAAIFVHVYVCCVRFFCSRRSSSISVFFFHVDILKYVQHAIETRLWDWEMVGVLWGARGGH